MEATAPSTTTTTTTTPNGNNNNNNNNVNKESDVYDRQIRLWGAEAQSRISSSSVLFVHVTGASSELLKNLVLAGVRAAVCDGRSCAKATRETPSSFLSADRRCDDATVARALEPAIRELNPFLPPPTLEERPLDEVPDEVFGRHSVVVASRVSPGQAARMAAIAARAGRRFVLVDCFGLRGCALLDPGPRHEYRREKGKNKWTEPTVLAPYVPLSKMLAAPLSRATDRWHRTCPAVYRDHRAILRYRETTGAWPTVARANEFAATTAAWLRDEQGLSNEEVDEEELRRLARAATAELAPVCAVLGGVLGNEIVKLISGRGQPANNVLVFDGADGGCRNFTIQG